MPGAGPDPARPAKGAADFKSAAYHRFRHPGPAKDSFAPRESAVARRHVLLAEATLLDVALARLGTLECELVDELRGQVLFELRAARHMRPGDEGDVGAELRVLGHDFSLRILVVERNHPVNRALGDLRPVVEDDRAVLEVVDGVELRPLVRVSPIDYRLWRVRPARARNGVGLEALGQGRDVRPPLRSGILVRAARLAKRRDC